MAKVSRANRENLTTLLRYGEAIMRGFGVTSHFIASEGKHAGYLAELLRLEKIKFVTIEIVGGSTFARITDAGRKHLETENAPS